MHFLLNNRWDRSNNKLTPDKTDQYATNHTIFPAIATRLTPAYLNKPLQMRLFIQFMQLQHVTASFDKTETSYLLEASIKLPT